MNHLDEILTVLRDNGKLQSDIRFCESGELCFTWLALKQVLAQASGHRHIRSDLKIVGNGWWLERDQWDGDDFWVFKTTPNQSRALLDEIYDLNIFAY